MLFLKRLSTSVALFLLLFCVLVFGAAFLEVVASHRAVAARGLTLEESREARTEFKQNWVKRYSKVVVFGSLGVAAVSSVALSFSGAFPWCRK